MSCVVMGEKEKSFDWSFRIYSAVGRIFGKRVHQHDEIAAFVVEEFGWVIRSHFLIESEC